MKKLLYICGILLLPVVTFSQYNDTSSVFPATKIRSPRDIIISPNPSNGPVKVIFAKDDNLYNSMMVYNFKGDEVYAKLHLNVNPVQVDLSNLAPGTYWAVFTGNNKTERVVKQIAIIK